jgi:2,3-bisphosphoglycerate-independent phosphoglycerate mutase
MTFDNSGITRPVALVILDGWGYAPRREGNAIAIAHTPIYDGLCRNYPMTVLAASGPPVGQSPDQPGNAELGHLGIGTGRAAETEAGRIRNSVRSGEFMQNSVLNSAFSEAAAAGSAVHLIGLVSDGGIHSSTENLFAILRLAKRHGLKNVFIHGILDGLDVPPRTADIYVEALEIKLADIGLGQIATLCGRYFAMDSGERWERTARAFTMLVHAEGERAGDAVTAVRNSFLRGISDEFIAPIIIERSPDVPLAKIRDGDLVVFFNHRGDAIRQLVRSLSIPEGSGSKPLVKTVCLTECDAAFDLPVAFPHVPETNTLTEVLASNGMPSVKITETARVDHLTTFFDGAYESHASLADHRFISGPDRSSELLPESKSFKITDQFRKSLHASPGRVFVVNMPAAGLMAEAGDLRKTVAAVQFIDTCVGGICEKMREFDGIVMITSAHGNCEEMVHTDSGDPNPFPTANPVPFHYIDYRESRVRLVDSGSLADIAPTILGVLNLKKPSEMTGSDLRI